MMRVVLSLGGAVLCAVVAACGGRDTDRVIDSAGGLVAIDSLTGDVAYRDVNYRLTSDNFSRFVAAQEAVDDLPQPPVLQRVDLRAPREEDVALVIRQLTDDEPARVAIEGAGLTARDFVLTSLALGQALAFANDRAVVVQPVNRLFVEDNRVLIEQLESRRTLRIGTRDRMRIKIREDVDQRDDDDGRRGRGKAKDKDKDKDDNRRGRGRG